MLCFSPVLALSRTGCALAQLLVRNQTSRPSCTEPRFIAPPLPTSCGLAWPWNALTGRPQPNTAAGGLHQRGASVCRSQSSAPSAQSHRHRGRLSRTAMYLDNASSHIIPATRLTATLQYDVGSKTAVLLKTVPSPVQESRISRHFLSDLSNAAISRRRRILRLPALNARRAEDPSPFPLPNQASAKLRRRSYGKSSFQVRPVQKWTPVTQSRAVH